MGGRCRVGGNTPHPTLLERALSLAISQYSGARGTGRVTMMTLPPVDTFPDFPDTFQDFFSKLDEGDETVSSLLEDKLIPRGAKRHQDRRWVITRRSFHRKPQGLDYMSRPDPPDLSPSPTHARRRSSSIAVARTPPDLHRFLQAEQSRPWGHLSPAACSPSPSPQPSRPVSPRPRTNGGNVYRCRTSSMPVVPVRHKVRQFSSYY